MATIKINFSYYEKLFWHFEFGNDHLLIEVILANMYDSNHINYKGNISIPWLLGLTCTDNVQWLRDFISITNPNYFQNHINMNFLKLIKNKLRY